VERYAIRSQDLWSVGVEHVTVRFLSISPIAGIDSSASSWGTSYGRRGSAART
jgi:hypothetical protein